MTSSHAEDADSGQPSNDVAGNNGSPGDTDVPVDEAEMPHPPPTATESRGRSA